jgi:hypothetical protein
MRQEDLRTRHARGRNLDPTDGAEAVIAALFVKKGGPYFGLDDVDPWDQSRDARTYAGPWPVVAHPPCSRWCQLAGLVEARWGHKRGEDGGAFASALNSVRTWGGVLEHPAYTAAWAAFGLPVPQRGGGWQRGLCGGWSCHVEQGRYGHRARKATWLYAVGCELPALRWGSTSNWPASWHHSKRDAAKKFAVSWCKNHGLEDVPRIGKREASATPIEFRDTLLEIARACRFDTSPDREAKP